MWTNIGIEYLNARNKIRKKPPINGYSKGSYRIDKNSFCIYMFKNPLLPRLENFKNGGFVYFHLYTKHQRDSAYWYWEEVNGLLLFIRRSNPESVLMGTMLYRHSTNKYIISIWCSSCSHQKELSLLRKHIRDLIHRNSEIIFLSRHRYSETISRSRHRYKIERRQLIGEIPRGLPTPSNKIKIKKENDNKEHPFLAQFRDPLPFPLGYRKRLYEIGEN